MEVLASILGGLVSGLFTFLGVLITIKYQHEKDRKEELRLQQEKVAELEKIKPRLEIQDYIEEKDYEETKNVDMNVLLVSIKDYEKEKHHFHYDPLVLDKKKWRCVEYVLKNIGGTEIDHLYLSTNLVKGTSLLNVLTEEYIADYNYMLLNYSVILEKSIKPQQIIRIRICYITDHIIVSNIGSAPISIWLIDTNKNVWEQPLFAPEKKLYNSTRSNMNEFREHTDISTAIKCFDNPYLW
jgi:hypothetical protein